MNKLSFRPRALESSKGLPIYRSEELSDLSECSLKNRAVPKFPSGMDKEEECEHHLQRAMTSGLTIPIPEVVCMEDQGAYNQLYPVSYKPPQQLIHMDPLAMDDDVLDYDMDSEDEEWLSKVKLDITPLKFEEMMDKLEKNCSQNVALENQKELLKDDDEISIAIFDYWLRKRLAKTCSRCTYTSRAAKIISLLNRGEVMSSSSNDRCDAILSEDTVNSEIHNPVQQYDYSSHINISEGQINQTNSYRNMAPEIDDSEERDPNSSINFDNDDLMKDKDYIPSSSSSDESTTDDSHVSSPGATNFPSVAINKEVISKQPLPLVPCVLTEANNRALGRSGKVCSYKNPYLAFRRRTEKMQTRKSRKDDEISYMKMVKLQTDLSRALQLLELVKKRESAKKDSIHVALQMFEQRYKANDFDGKLLEEVSSNNAVRLASDSMYPSSLHEDQPSACPLDQLKVVNDELSSGRKEKRQPKKWKKKSLPGGVKKTNTGDISSAEKEVESSSSSPQLAFPFHRSPHTTYQAPKKGGGLGNWDWTGPKEGGAGVEKYRFSLATVTHPNHKCVGLVRRRMGRGGRVVLDRAGPSVDDFWSSLDFTILDNAKPPTPCTQYFRPKTPPPESVAEVEEDDMGAGALSLTVDSLIDGESIPLEVDLGELSPSLDLPRSNSQL